MNLTEFHNSAPALYRSGTALELISGPGVGKSSVMHQVAAFLSKYLGVPFGIVSLIMSGRDPMDVRGFLMPLKSEGTVEAKYSRPSIFPSPWNIDVYVDGARDTDWQGGIPEHGILFLDEFGQADHEVQKPMGELLLEGHMGEHKLGKGWVVWAASNRTGDRSGVVKELAFLTNRRKVLNIEAQYDPWEAWAMRNHVHALTIGFAKRHPQEVFKEEVPSKPGPFCTPRSLVLCSQDLEAMRTEEHGDMRLPDDHIALEVATGWLGEGTAPQYMQFVRLANDLPELDDIVRKPDTTMVPERLDARFVIAMMLGHHASKDNMGAVLTYIERIDKELQMLFVSSVGKRNPKALATREFSAWNAKNTDLTLASLG